MPSPRAVRTPPPKAPPGPAPLFLLDTRRPLLKRLFVRTQEQALSPISPTCLCVDRRVFGLTDKVHQAQYVYLGRPPLSLLARVCVCVCARARVCACPSPEHLSMIFVFCFCSRQATRIYGVFTLCVAGRVGGCVFITVPGRGVDPAGSPRRNTSL